VQAIATSTGGALPLTITIGSTDAAVHLSDYHMSSAQRALVAFTSGGASVVGRAQAAHLARTSTPRPSSWCSCSCCLLLLLP
jgi:hypothetical protein